MVRALIWLGLVVVGGLVGAGCASPQVAKQVTTAEMLSRSTDAVVMVDGANCDSRVQGSATIVKVGDQERLLTNRHVVAGVHRLQIAGVNHDPATARTSPKYDLASIEFDPSLATRKTPLQAAQKNVSAGDPVTLMGYAADRRLQAKPATVQLFSDGEIYGFSGPVMLLDQATEAGFSGGAVLNRNGRVVGILMAVDKATGLSIALPLDVLTNEATFNKMVSESASC